VTTSRAPQAHSAQLGDSPLTPDSSRSRAMGLAENRQITGERFRAEQESRDRRSTVVVANAPLRLAAGRGTHLVLRAVVAAKVEGPSVVFELTSESAKR
jgi:hypothetical protein